MSSTIEFIPYQPGHGCLIDRSDSDGAWLANPGFQFDAQAASGTAITMLADRRVVCIGGVARLWPGLGEVWMVPTRAARKKPLALTHAAIETIEYSLQSLRLNRVQCFCKTEDERAKRWAVALGFSREATLRKYGAEGSDYDIFSIVR
jgi:hypothetical protein